MSVKLVEAGQLIELTARYLKENGLVKPPTWAPYVKTGVSRERPPADPDWWYVRSASILRRLYLKGPIGVSRLRKYYGGRHRVGHGAPRFAKGSGTIVRKMCQQLEVAGLVQRADRKGRVLTDKGRKLLNSLSKSLLTKR
ncbi:MAG: 30S ribosomal protein S19e [Aigarchaeota archaeon]|nr:30S ribosomal protein S19e [Aigarchaeota archaeon]MDW8093116.1 30S ribosomal protein S19e [Nitrososphaerota archaeon]